VNHKYLIDKFTIEANLILNNQEGNPSMPVTTEAPYFQASIFVGERNEEIGTR